MADIYIECGQSIKSESGNFYRILEFLGNGANAFAYRCICTSGLNRGMEFVLKIQYNLSSETRRERFLREAAFLQTCSHPAILAQYDSGTFVTQKNRFPFIITNYMPETLQERLKVGSLAFDTKTKMACELLSAVAFLQQQKIVHRDIKPGNIFISENNAILGDFGLIKKIEAGSDDNSEDDVELVNETVMNQFSGYVAMARYYRTPELVAYANHEDILHVESDVFQLGLVLTELFTGNNPLIPADDLRSPIKLGKIGHVECGDRNNGKLVHNTLAEMLDLNWNTRIKIDQAIDKFTGLYANLMLKKKPI